MLDTTQEYTSADTSLNQIPALHRWYAARVQLGAITRPMYVVDLGAGKYDAAGKRIVEADCYYLPYDPYNRTESENIRALWALSTDGLLTDVLCANVLNVIKEKSVRQRLIELASKASGCAYFAVYEGNGSGEGHATTKGWQNNRKLMSYVPELAEFFQHIERKGNVLVCSN